jgi:hypothetical protein
MLPRYELLADSASIARGRDYFTRGRVLRIHRKSDGSLEGVVEGEHFYRVRLDERSWDCDCPMGIAGVFCKHCVALALAGAAPEEDQNSKPTPVPASPDESGPATLGLREAQKTLLVAFRSRRDLHDWRSVDHYARVAHTSVDELRDASHIWGAAALIPTVQKAIAATARVLHHADDSNGVIGGVVDYLLDLHAELCRLDPPPTRKLVDWLIDFQFDGSQDFFTPDIAAYADALGETGLNHIGARLHGMQDQFGPPTQDFNSDHHRVRHNLQRLAVARRDPQGVIDSFGELVRSYRLHDLAKALMEIDAIDLAIIFAQRGATIEDGWQAEKCALYWSELLAQHRDHAHEIDARRQIFERWPTASNALSLARAMGDDWESIAEDAYARLLTRSIRDLIETLLGLGLDDRAWNSAQGHALDAQLWGRLVVVREKTDPASVLPILRQLIANDLEVADARNYKSAARRLKQLRRAMVAAGAQGDFDGIVSELREQHKRRPRLMEELLRAGL